MKPLDPLSERELEILGLLAEGLTNRQIAQALSLSLATIKWYNSQIYSKLDVSSRTQAAAKARETGLLGVATEDADTSAAQHSHNLPAELTTFVGRQQQIAQVTGLLKKSRLVTLTGPGGSGKTRLALQIARRVAGNYAQGVTFVGLAPTADPALVANTVARALGTVEQPDRSLVKQLQHTLGGKQLLLILDNFEHVLAASPLVTELLAAAPRLTVLATSREALRLSGEQEYWVPPLLVPALAESRSPSELAANESIDLFVQRAQAASHTFHLTEENAATVAAICRGLDGLPLAIELAAARIKMFSPGAMLERLESRLSLLTTGVRDSPARQRTLRGTIDWSYELLDEVERRLFARLAVFTGGRTLEAIEGICSSGLSLNTLDGVDSLLNKSLIYAEPGPDGEPRFLMLETIHEYARERLAASGEEWTLCQRHLDFFVNWAEAQEPGYWQHGQLLLLEQTEAEMGNLRAAFDWAMGNDDVEAAARLVTSLEYFLGYRNHFVEGYRWIKLVLAKLEDVSVNYRVRLFLAACRMAYVNGDHGEGKTLAREAEQLAWELGDRRGLAWAKVYRAICLISPGDAAEIDESLELVEEGLTLARQLGAKPVVAQGLSNLGNLASLAGDHARAEQAFEACLLLCQETGEVFRESMMRGNLAIVANMQGDYASSRALATSYLKQMFALGAKRHVHYGLSNLAGSLANLGEAEKAARLLGAAAKLMSDIDVDYEPMDSTTTEKLIGTVQGQLGQAAYTAAWAEGQAMDLDRAVAYALGD